MYAESTVCVYEGVLQRQERGWGMCGVARPLVCLRGALQVHWFAKFVVFLFEDGSTGLRHCKVRQLVETGGYK